MKLTTQDIQAIAGRIHAAFPSAEQLADAIHEACEGVPGEPPTDTLERVSDMIDGASYEFPGYVRFRRQHLVFHLLPIGDELLGLHVVDEDGNRVERAFPDPVETMEFHDANKDPVGTSHYSVPRTVRVGIGPLKLHRWALCVADQWAEHDSKLDGPSRSLVLPVDLRADVCAIINASVPEGIRYSPSDGSTRYGYLIHDGSVDSPLLAAFAQRAGLEEKLVYRDKSGACEPWRPVAEGVRHEWMFHRIKDLEQGKHFLRQLAAHGLTFHLEDDPETIIDGRTGGPTFDPREVPLLRQRVRELYALNWSDDGHDCPIGYLLNLEKRS